MSVWNRSQEFRCHRLFFSRFLQAFSQFSSQKCVATEFFSLFSMKFKDWQTVCFQYKVSFKWIGNQKIWNHFSFEANWVTVLRISLVGGWLNDVGEFVSCDTRFFPKEIYFSLIRIYLTNLNKIWSSNKTSQCWSVTI